jgi:hypothetical protein
VTATLIARADVVSDHLDDLGLGHIDVPNRADLDDADSQVEVHVDAVRDAETVPDVDALAADVVSGKIKPETAVKRLSSATSLKAAGGRSRLDALLAATHRAAVAHLDRTEFSATSLRRSVVPEVRSRLQRVADDMITTMGAIPATVLGHLTQVVDGMNGSIYGPAPSNQTAGALQFLSPDGDLSRVRGSDLQATQDLITAWRWVNADPAPLFDALYWLGMGRSVGRSSTNDLQGAGAEAAEQFRPEYLLVGGDDVDYLAAGIPIAWLVASGTVTEFDVLADPFGEDAEAYSARVERVAQFLRWRDEIRDVRNSGAGHLLTKEQVDRLEVRGRLSKLRQVEVFRAGGEL